MHLMRESWTDDRLDDLRNDVSEFRAETKAEFAAVQDEFTAVRKEMGSEFAAVRKEMGDEFKAVRAEMKAGFDGIHERFDRFQQTMIGFSGLVIAALIGLIATQL